MLQKGVIAPTPIMKPVPSAPFPCERESGINEFFSSLELLGIPQILIKNDAPQYVEDGDPITCVAPIGGTAPSYTPSINPLDDNDNSVSTSQKKRNSIPGTLSIESDPIAGAEFEQDGDSRYYYKASDESNFSEDLRQIFSPG